jgi:hypothetical protein
MTIKLDNEDFVLGAIAAKSDELQVEWLACGNDNIVGFEWYLITSDDHQSIIALCDFEGSSATPSEEFEFTDKKDLTERLMETIRYDRSREDLEASIAVILGSESASINPEFIDKDTLLQLVQRGMAQLNSEFDPQAWSKQVGFK